MPKSLESKFTGGMVGSSLGDAIGELAFSYRSEPELRAEIGRLDRLVYTDDTAMSVGLAQSITGIGRLDERHAGNIFRANFNREPWRGYAPGPPTIFDLVEKYGLSYSEAAGRLFGGQGSFGNGAAMRIAPVGLFYYDAQDLYKQAEASAAITHVHPIGVDGAAVLARAVAQAVELDPGDRFPVDDFSLRLIDFARTKEISTRMRLLKRLVTDGVPAPEASGRLGRGVAVQESMPFAIYAFLSRHRSFEDCLFCAVLNGGDRDTLGAMACAVAGAYHGVEAIPLPWREKLENRKLIEELALRLLKIRLRS